MTAAVLGYLAHSQLPPPAHIIQAKALSKEDSDQELLNFLNTFNNTAYKFTIDGDNVGQGVICAFLRDSPSIKAAMFRLNKHQIQSVMTKQGYFFSISNSGLIQCIKNENSIAKL